MRSGLKRTAAAAGALVFFGSPVAALEDGAAQIVRHAEAALAKGYGQMCSLENLPVSSGGYYPCLDFGPYRYVRAYGKVMGFVIQEGLSPFEVMAGPPSAPKFTVSGPWEKHMEQAATTFINDVVNGGSDKADTLLHTHQKKQSAIEYIGSIISPLDEGAGDKPVENEQKTGMSPLDDPVGSEIDMPVEDIRSLLQAQ